MFLSRDKSSHKEPYTETDTWYTPQSIRESYETIEKEIMLWRKNSTTEVKSSLDKLRNIINRGRNEKIFQIDETIPPRLIKIIDRRVGYIYFELADVEQGGTIVKSTYHPSVKHRIARFKANSDVIIPAIPTSSPCPSCGKQLFPEFILCPYCGEKLK